VVYGFLADAIVAIHSAFVGFVLLGQAAILAGLCLRWQWIRNPWFRLGHLGAIVVVAFESMAGIACPLTVWEYRLRDLAGQKVSDATFIGRIIHDMLFYGFQPWVFNTMYVGFALLVVATFILAPPRFTLWRGKSV